MSSSVTRALNFLKRAGAPRDCWGDYLYRARSITQEHSAQIKTKATGSEFGPKPKMAYYFAVLKDLLGLKPDATIRHHPAAGARTRTVTVQQFHPTRHLRAADEQQDEDWPRRQDDTDACRSRTLYVNPADRPDYRSWRSD